MNRFIAITLGALALFFINGCSNDDGGEITTEVEAEDFSIETYTDPRDGNNYETVKIGDQTWFAENLNFDMDGSLCYDDNSSNCFTYGRLYRSDSALVACPEGWRLPSETDWEELFDYLGGVEVATFLLTPDAEIQNTKVNFNLLPAGRYWSSTVGFELINTAGFYWTSTEGVSQFATTKFVYFEPDNVLSIDQESPGRQFSCRCIKETQ